MKKLIAGSLAAICLFLCACGSYRDMTDTTPGTMPPTMEDTTPETMPPTMEDMMPDTEDGIVEDNDGLIEEDDNETERSKQADSTNRH